MNNMPTSQRVAVYGFILNDQGKVLLVKRAADDSSPNVWEMPGGGLDHGETPEAGTQREVLEEAGLQVKVILPVTTESGVSTRDRTRQYVRIAFLCKLIGQQEVVLSSEHSEYQWISLHDSLPLPISPLFEKCLETITVFPHLITLK